MAVVDGHQPRVRDEPRQDAPVGDRHDRQRIEFIFVTLIGFCRWVGGREVNPRAIELSYPVPADPGPYRAAFRCPVSFDAPRNSLVFAHADMITPLPTSNPQLADLHERFAGEYLQHFDHAQTSYRAREVIIRRLPDGELRRDEVAGELCMSERTLQRRLEEENQTLRNQLGHRYQVIGDSIPMKALRQQIAVTAPTNGRVLIYGESGTGKELVAHALHAASLRTKGPFVEVNCAAIPDELIESELFGHLKGSFTGATENKIGKFEKADSGTLFLDEIGDMSLRTQSKVLRVLEEQRFEPVGSNQTITVDVRVIAATNKNLEQEITHARFRQDLFYRLNAVSIVLPPLRERREDILPLTKYFAERVYSLNSSVSFSPEALALLETYPWPGNIRELENAVVRAAAMCDGTIRPPDLPERIRNYREAVSEVVTPTDGIHSDLEAEWVPLAEIEGRYVARVLQHTRGNKQAAARLLSVDRKTLDRMIKRHKLGPDPAVPLAPRAAWTN